MSFQTEKIWLTPEGGMAVKLLNATSASSIKGYSVSASVDSYGGVRLTPINVPDSVGVFYESGIANATSAWIVVSGVADVYFVGAATMGNIARTFVSADSGGVSGMALSEAAPTSPFSTDKHFCEIGHVLQTTTGAGLARCVLHFN